MLNRSCFNTFLVSIFDDLNAAQIYSCFNTFLVSIFDDLNAAQIYKVPYRDRPHHENENKVSFQYLILFKPNEHTEDYHIRKPNDRNFLFEIEDKKHIYVGEKVITFKTND